MLFGTVRGAYSGAQADALGYVQAADGGAFFLDEIGELDLVIQAKLLRFLETREAYAVGATHPRRVDLSVCFATHRDLREMVRKGQFCEDLYFRIGQPKVLVPPLVERPEEVPWPVVDDRRREHWRDREDHRRRERGAHERGHRPRHRDTAVAARSARVTSPSRLSPWPHEKPAGMRLAGPRQMIHRRSDPPSLSSLVVLAALAVAVGCCGPETADEAVDEAVPACDCIDMDPFGIASYRCGDRPCGTVVLECDQTSDDSDDVPFSACSGLGELAVDEVSLNCAIDQLIAGAPGLVDYEFSDNGWESSRGGFVKVLSGREGLSRTWAWEDLGGDDSNAGVVPLKDTAYFMGCKAEADPVARFWCMTKWSDEEPSAQCDGIGSEVDL